MFDIFSLLIGFIPLFWGANMLVDGSSALVKKTGFTNFFMGLTVVAFGTSSPEMTVNIFAAIRHDNFITMGNVLGSNIFNTAFILAIVAIIMPIVLKSKTVRIETLSVFIVAIVLLIFSNDRKIFGAEFNIITRKEGLILLGIFMVYFILLIRTMVNRSASEPIEEKTSKSKAFFQIFLGLALLIAGSQLIIFSAQNLSDYLNISERIVALIFISIGTSLPELATALMAVKKGNTEIIYGNLVGSNIFNGLFVVGLSALINPVRVSSGIQQDLIVHLIVSTILLAFLLPAGIKKISGGVLLAIYFSYVFYLFVLMV